MLGFSLVELVGLGLGLVIVAAALQMARMPRAASPLVRVLIAVLLVAVIAASWGTIRYATERSTEAAMRAARSHGVHVEALRAASGGSPSAEGAKDSGGSPSAEGAKDSSLGNVAGSKRTATSSMGNSTSGARTSAARSVSGAKSGTRSGAARELHGEDEDEEAEGDEEEEEEEAPETEEELFASARGEEESESEYMARRLRADHLLSLRAGVEGMVGGVRASSGSVMEQPRRIGEAQTWIGGDSKLAHAITLQGLRSHTASTLYAKESYAALEQANHDDYGEGMDLRYADGADLRYVDPSLRNFDYAFAAYDDKPVPTNPLPVNTPMLF
jgi:hypothetical protein